MSRWSKLQLPNGNPTPPLLYKYLTSNLGCEIYLTDLAYVWSQSLTRKEILNNASKYNTSIDPSEDEEQYFILLHKISDALRGSKDSSLSLTSDTGGEELKLITSTELPAPLDPLEWTFTLSPQSPNALTKHILLPILKGEANHEARILSLIGYVKQKDWALSKLFDKIESSGVDLSTVFPGMGGVRLSRKESVYSQASKHIKGVAPFDEDLWNNEYQSKDADYNLGVHITNELSTSSSFADRPADDFAPENWWKKLGTGPVGKLCQTTKKDKYQEKPTSRNSSPSVEKEAATQSDDDEFQTMETPPRLRSPSRKQTTHNNLRKSSSPPRKRHVESDQDLTEGSSAPPTSPKSRSKNVGAVGGHSKQKKLQAPSSAESTASEQEEEDDVRSASKHTSIAKGLGRIGGRHPAKRQQSLMESAESTQSEAESEAAAKPKPKPKAKGGLGIIGGKKKTEIPRQETPITSTASDVPAGPKRTEKAIDTDDMPTESENDTDLSTSRQSKRKLPPLKEQTSSPPLKPQPKPRGIGGIGQIGGKKKQLERISPSDQSETTKTKKANGNHDEEGDEMETSPGSRQTSTKPKHPGGKLGIIGGRGKPAAPTSRKERSTSANNEENRVLGRDMSESSPPPKQPPAELEGEEAEAKQEAKEETPEERANRKREELRKQLEARNKGAGVGTGVGGPAKKKRRF
ncbi:hypothetical protein EMCG_00621 [[Emmonsia] crescens]|uniref:Non-homologous end-joining factor 1 n=1 Tax=[Emmonsia] crescens TaxID=73230 RepID=A0A0G2HSN9_9EURO|nr:hypothetical protein EMCG_00621 [Emmonsia crescens UAMH 3008]